MTTNNAVNTGLSGTTGSGNFVGANSPTLITPVLGVATGTSFNAMTGVATKAQQNTGTDTTNVVVPAYQYSNPAGIKAWANIASNATINDSFNITSVSRSSAGVYVVTLTNAMSNSNYCVLIQYTSTGQAFYGVTLDSSTQFTIHTYTSGGSAADTPVCFAAIGHSTA